LIKISIYFARLLYLSSVTRVYLGVKFYLIRRVVFIEWELLSLNSVRIIITILLDWIRLTFLGFVIIISSIVIVYSTSYIKDEVHFVRFIWLVYLFVLSIVLLIIRPNIVRILLGWDGLGLVSYCLVIYYHNVKSANAGILTILSNRIGDVAILLCISWIFNYGGWNFYYLPYLFRREELKVVIFLVLVAALTRRAQIPFSAWLPAAIAAPTPVSSLVHSSTLVTAGVYLLIRFRELLGVRFILLVISIITIIISGVNANLEIDLKKVIALSTLRQLGVIIITISIGLVEIAFFHLLRHALFKSLLFLCAGVFIHRIGDTQDIRDLGGVRKIFPVTSFYFLGCSLSLCGFPYLSGFYSKDVILETYFILGGLNFLIYIIIFFSILLTRLYSARLAFILLVKPLGFRKINNQDEDKIITYPIRVLFYLAIRGGSLIIWWFIPPLLIILTILVKILVFFISVALSILVFVNFNNLILLKKFKLVNFYYFYGLIINIPYLSTYIFIPALNFGFELIKKLDQGWTEMLGGQGFIKKIRSYRIRRDKFNFLSIKLYLSMFIFFLIIIVIII